MALIQGIFANAQFIDRAAKNMVSAYENENKAGIQKNAEAILNLLVGNQSQQHKDWDGDGQLTDPGDGYGFLINADNLGYIQAIYSHADYAANSPGASQNMIVNGGNVRICAQNLAVWAAQLKDNVLTILTSDSSELDQLIRDSAALANQMLNGLDEDRNGIIEAIAGECGVLTSYEDAYRMVDMPLLPVNLIDTPTPTSTSSIFIQATKTLIRQPNESPQNTPQTQNTPVPPPNNNPQPTKKLPKPTRTPKK